MKLLIKLGGTLLDEDASRQRITAEIADVAREHAVTVVHGGGKQMTRFLSERGVESRFVNGLRVTTPDVIDAVLKVFAGSVNHQLVASLVAEGADAVGLSGIDAGLTEAEQLNAELGAVGRVVRSNPRLLNVLTGQGFIPVVACVAGDRQGNIYNVNADSMAVACAAAFGANRLYFLTDVEGVRGADGQRAPSLTSRDCEQLISSGVATGGMLAKLNAACDALRGGVHSVVIAPGAKAGIIRLLLSGAPEGTTIGEAAHHA